MVVSAILLMYYSHYYCIHVVPGKTISRSIADIMSLSHTKYVLAFEGFWWSQYYTYTVYNEYHFFPLPWFLLPQPLMTIFLYKQAWHCGSTPHPTPLTFPLFDKCWTHISPNMPGWSCKGICFFALMRKMAIENCSHSYTSRNAAGASYILSEG